MTRTVGTDDTVFADDATQQTVAATQHPRTLGGTGESVALKRGEHVGRYVILRRLGEGGMGVVYAAYDPELDRRIALKLLRADSGLQRSWLQREAQAMAKLNHPNAVTVHDVGEHIGQVYIAMEFLEGQTLGAWQQQSRSWREVVATYRMAGAGLAAAHDRGLVHRDFKPDNAMVTDTGRVCVLDFGLARPAIRDKSEADHRGPMVPTQDALSLELTAGGIVGTPAYLSPERFLWEDADAKSDQFAFCVALFEALYGLRPFAGDTLNKLRAAVLQGQIQPPPRRARVPRWLRRVVLRGLASAREDRWPSMHDLLDALARDPTPKRIVAIATSLVLVTGAGTWGTWSWQQHQRTEMCRDAGNAIAELWNEETKVRIGTAMTSTGVSYADSTTDKVLTRIDAFVEKWRETRTSTCRGCEDLDPALAQRADDCLDEATQRLSALLDNLKQADANIIRRAVTAAAALPQPARCREPDHLRLRPAMPDDPHMREQVRELQKMHVKIVSLKDAGLRVDDAVQRFYSRAKEVGWPPLLNEARRELGWVLRSSDFDRSTREHEDAFYDAGTSGDDAAAMRAARGLTEVHRLAGKPEQALLWGRAMDMMRVRAGIEQRSVLAGMNSFSLGQVYRDVGQLERAEETFKQTLEIYRREYDRQHPILNTVFIELGNVAFLRDDFDTAREHYNRALELTEGAFGTGHPRLGIALGSLGNVAFKTGDMREGIRLVTRALHVFENALGPHDDNVVTALLNLGEFYVDVGELDRAAHVQHDAVERISKSRGPDHPDIGYAVSTLATIDLRRGALDEALAGYTRAAAIFETITGRERDLTLVLHKLAAVHLRDGDTDAAIAEVNRALAVCEGKEGLRLPELELHLTLARIHLQSGDLSQADAALAEVLKRHGVATVDEVEHADTLIVWSERNLLHRDDAGAQKLASKALEQLPADASVVRAGPEFVLARALFEQGSKRQARELAERARDAYREAGGGYGEQVREIEAWLARD